MKHDNGYLVTKDQYRLHWQSWRPEQKPIACVFILHGIADHSARFIHVAHRYCAQRIACFAIDLRGHGKSSGTTVYINRFKEYVQDLQDGWDKMNAMFDNKEIPYFLYGHSMGSLIAIHFIYDRQPSLNGFITTAALVKVNEDLSPILIKLSGFLSKVFPKLKTIKLDLSQLSSDNSIQKAVQEDPLYHTHGLRARTGSEVLIASKPALQYVQHINLPVLILHGGKDTLTKPESSELFFENVGSTDKRYVIFPDAFHELVNEVNKEEVISTMIKWIKEHL